MTLEQMEAFITISRHLSFTKASEILFTSQSNLSRMITALESELNMQLFIRGSRSVRLTPAGLVLYQEFSKVYEQIKTSIEQAKDVNLGKSGKINIGILDGTDVSDFMPEVLAYFKKNYPNIQLSLNSYSFKDLVEGLYDETIDLAFSLEFNFTDYSNIVYEVLEDSADNLAVHRTSPLFAKDEISLQDLHQHDLIVVSPDDLSLTKTAVMKEFQKAKIAPNFRMAPNLRTVMLWLESGLGAAFLFSRNRLIYNADIKFFQVNSPWKTAFVIGWNKDNLNPSIPIVLEYCLEQFHSTVP